MPSDKISRCSDIPNVRVQDRDRFQYYLTSPTDVAARRCQLDYAAHNPTIPVSNVLTLGNSHKVRIRAASATAYYS